MNYYGSICLSDIPKDKIKKSEKNGKLYLNIEAVAYKETNAYGNSHFLSVSASKDERNKEGFKPSYIGNLKERGEEERKPSSDELADLPF